MALGLLKKRKVEGVLVAKLDRPSRSVLIETYFSNGHGALLSVGEQTDTSTAAGRFMVNVRGSLAQWERETISERTATALRHKRASGQVFNHPPLGYGWVAPWCQMSGKWRWSSRSRSRPSARCNCGHAEHRRHQR
jgi:site-specific DNA recombinase